MPGAECHYSQYILAAWCKAQDEYEFKFLLRSSQIWLKLCGEHCSLIFIRQLIHFCAVFLLHLFLFLPNSDMFMFKLYIKRNFYP
jgi:hypothetical protein